MNMQYFPNILKTPVELGVVVVGQIFEAVWFLKYQVSR